MKALESLCQEIAAADVDADLLPQKCNACGQLMKRDCLVREAESELYWCHVCAVKEVVRLGNQIKAQRDQYEKALELRDRSSRMPCIKCGYSPRLVTLQNRTRK